MTEHVLVFDLDDTLYDEMSFVRSGFRAVAAWGETHLGREPENSYNTLVSLLTKNGRGRVFDDWLAGSARTSDALAIYRRHEPNITLWPSAHRLLDRYRGAALYLVTDGHKGVQARKLTALGLWDRVSRAYLTSRYGRRRAKPSPYCFQLIAAREGVPMSSLIHVADNPTKDFVGINPLGVTTVRVLTGQHSTVTALPGAEAQHRISDLDALPALLDALETGLRPGRSL